MHTTLPSLWVGECMLGGICSGYIWSTAQGGDLQTLINNHEQWYNERTLDQQGNLINQ